MTENEHIVRCKLSQIGTMQEKAELTYSATYKTEGTSIIEARRSNSENSYSEIFVCNINFNDSIGLITLFKENCVYPSHCKDIASDLGYKTYAV